jgi:hypothetical protein
MSNVHPYPSPPEPAADDAIRFAYWVPNVSGGLVVSKIEQRTHWNIDYNRKLVQTRTSRTSSSTTTASAPG